MENLINEHGYTYKGIGWSRAEDQILRFDQFKYLFSNQNQSFSLNNLGCGLGDFFTWLLKNKLPINNYYGYDLSDKVIKGAIEITNSKKAIFFKSSKIKNRSDFSIACRVFNYNFGI